MDLKEFNLQPYSEYQQIEKNMSNTHNRRCIDGRITGSSKCVGYCKCSMHEGFLTEKLRRQHQCLSKNCFHYVAKEAVPGSYITVPSLPDFCEKIQHFAEKETLPFEGMKVLSTRQAAKDQFIINYITISNSYPIIQIAQKLSELFQCKVSMNKINCDYDRAVALIFA